MRPHPSLSIAVPFPLRRMSTLHSETFTHCRRATGQTGGLTMPAPSEAKSDGLTHPGAALSSGSYLAKNQLQSRDLMARPFAHHQVRLLAVTYSFASRQFVRRRTPHALSSGFGRAD